MNILILGSTGMLGSEVLKVFSKKKNYSISTNFRNKKKKFYLTKNKIKNINYFKFDIYKNKIVSKKEFRIYEDNIIYIGVVARLVPQKRIDLLIKAFIFYKNSI